MSDVPRIALFGGTFDPVHEGHLHLASEAKSALALDQVRFIPCQISPHKLDHQPASAADRLAMLKLATAQQPWAVVDDIETLRQGPSYSWQTATEMRQRFPDARLFWIMGTDQWWALPTWSHPERLASCVEFIVFSRGDHPDPRDGYSLHHLHADHPASSTKIRQDLSSNRQAQWLHPDTLKYINQHCLYHSSMA